VAKNSLWRAETFKLSTDPELVAKVTGVIGLTCSCVRQRPLSCNVAPVAKILQSSERRVGELADEWHTAVGSSHNLAAQNLVSYWTESEVLLVCCQPESATLENHSRRNPIRPTPRF
jgi:hypothetical protein